LQGLATVLVIGVNDCSYFGIVKIIAKHCGYAKNAYIWENFNNLP